MVKNVEIKQTVYGSEIIENLHAIQKLSQNILDEMQCIQEVNLDDFQYLDVALERIKINLLKVNNIIKLQITLHYFKNGQTVIFKHF